MHAVVEVGQSFPGPLYLCFRPKNIRVFMYLYFVPVCYCVTNNSPVNLKSEIIAGKTLTKTIYFSFPWGKSGDFCLHFAHEA